MTSRVPNNSAPVRELDHLKVIELDTWSGQGGPDA